MIVMKKILALILLACSLTAQSVDYEIDIKQRLDSFVNINQDMERKIYEASSMRDTARLIELDYYAIGLVDANKEFLSHIIGERQLYSMKANFFYDLACIYSRKGLTEAGFYHLTEAAKFDYNDWKHILEDHDLDNLRNDVRLDSIVAQIRARADYLEILKHAAPYTRNERTDTLPTFTYQSPDDPYLQRVREYFKLDSVAGKGDEISKIKNILTYIHNLIRHDGSHANPEHINAIDLAEACKDGSRGLNCRGLAIVLNECYLSMGIPARYVTCMPKEYINDCHVINAVWSKQLRKWLWMDPTWNAWVMDEKGNLLSIQEVRENLRNDIPVVLNDEANWNNENKQTTEEYLYNYMAKNLYYVTVSANQAVGLEDPAIPTSPTFVNLMPTGFTVDNDRKLAVNDDAWFWQAPK